MMNETITTLFACAYAASYIADQIRFSDKKPAPTLRSGAVLRSAPTLRSGAVLRSDVSSFAIRIPAPALRSDPVLHAAPVPPLRSDPVLHAAPVPPLRSDTVLRPVEADAVIVKAEATKDDSVKRTKRYKPHRIHT